MSGYQPPEPLTTIGGEMGGGAVPQGVTYEQWQKLRRDWQIKYPDAGPALRAANLPAGPRPGAG